MKLTKLCLFSVFAVSLLLLSVRIAAVLAFRSDDLKVTVKISVCGNRQVEDGEDCEGENLHGATCESLGFGPGVLTCDIACSFDTSGCSPAPTPTPTATATPIPTSTATSTPAPAASATTVSTGQTAESASATTPTPGLTAGLQPEAKPDGIPSLPFPLRLFDFNQNGLLDLLDIPLSIEKWVFEWRQKDYDQAECDLNADRVCNLIDLSVLLYYVGRSPD